MIPEFTDDGHLPPGIHAATLNEIRDRFGKETELRQVQMESVGWLIDIARRAGVQRIIVNGSFVTDKPEPNDVDCVLLIAPGYPDDAAAAAELDAGLPFIDLHIVGSEIFGEFLEKIFAIDRLGIPKGVIEVVA